MPGWDAPTAYKALRQFYTEIQPMLDWPSDQLFRAVPAVSGWSTGQHLDHLMRANRGIFVGLQRMSEGQDLSRGQTGGLRWTGWLLLTLGVFPRGGRAPASTHPPDALTAEVLAQTVQKSRAALEALEPLLPTLADLPSRMPHPYFGMLNAPQWLRFAQLHSRHHARIIRQIATQP
jgi:hypothetical protein